MNSQIIELIKNSNRYVDLSNGVKLKILDDNDVEFALYHLDKNGRPFFSSVIAKWILGGYIE